MPSSKLPTNFNLRGILPEVMLLLQREAKRLNISVNTLILNVLEKGIGFSCQIKRPVYHDLDHLAGSWSEKDTKTFLKNTEYFEQIDKEFWS